ncbi:hypothetical protein HHK36_012600 [Tetracentron sinense]|uniref:Uncharacterized protein n=1 Tax=Tetracentron sinense TaxID=13715 RepID=A0A834Z632_TETSI|nr:hypothetical protein HHK36_012600 [Tetracentron sinense]
MPFLTGKAERFVNEVELFLASGLNVEAYDEVYLQCLGLDTPGVIQESTGLHEATPQVPYLDIFDEDMEATPQVPYDFFDEDMDRCD